jgi:hypothetical protein
VELCGGGGVIMCTLCDSSACCCDGCNKFYIPACHIRCLQLCTYLCCLGQLYMVVAKIRGLHMIHAWHRPC